MALSTTLRRVLGIIFAATLVFGAAACSDEDGDGATTDEETDQITDDVDDGTDEIQQQVDEGAEEGSEGEG